jgi:lipopolysaccharide export system protein LptA
MTKTGSYTKAESRMFIFLLFALLAFSGTGFAQTKKKVEIVHCDMLNFNERIVANAQRLLGNVNIKVDGALMWCDSLYSYTNNTVDAFGNVHIVRGDTLNMYADFINYNGNTKLAKARRNVKLIDKKMTLTTDSLDYNMVNDMASYNYSGTVKDSTNVLTSLIGQYHVNEKKAYFRTKVDGVTKDYKIKSDTLIYFTNTKKVYIEGPTHIFNEKDTLYAEYGWYDSMKNLAHLTKNPRIWNVKQKIKADSIFYDKEKGEGLALGHARLQDIENSIIVVGNRVEYNDISKIALATDSAMLIQYSEKDSLFLHADILRTLPDTTKSKKPNPSITASKLLAPKTAVSDTLNSVAQATAILNAKTAVSDTIKTVAPEAMIQNAKTLSTDTTAISTLVKDTTAIKKTKDARLVLAYHKVRFFRGDLQGKCDSLAYWSKDSTIQLYTEPVIWSNKNQLTANYIEMINRSKDPDEVKMKEDAFIISMENDSIRFNQIKGKNMTGFIRENELYRIDVKGNGQSNYYARDKNGIIGLNKAESSNITIYLNKGKVQKITFIKSPEGELKPMEKIEEGDKILPGFKWQDDIRPKSKEDIFRDPIPGTLPKTVAKPAPEKMVE